MTSPASPVGAFHASNLLTYASLAAGVAAIAFGIAPAVCATLLRGDWWGGPAAASLWWLSVAAYAVCAITRLAFYNVTQEEAAGFVGLPVPVAALIWATALLFAPGPAVSTALVAVTAAAMVLPLRIPRPRGIGLATFSCWPVMVIVAHIARA